LSIVFNDAHNRRDYRWIWRALADDDLSSHGARAVPLGCSPQRGEAERVI
jgi:hypothetical protein